MEQSIMNIQVLKYPHPFSSICYLISSGGEYAVIDPSHPYEPDLIDGRLKYVLLTHAHFDHFLDIESWEKTRVPILVCKYDLGGLGDPVRNCYKIFDGSEVGYHGRVSGISDGDVLRLGETEIKVMGCPGHTIGSVTYLVDNYAFVGDTIFAGGIHGRFDLPTGNLVMLRDSISRLVSLPESVIVYPGHGKSTTIKQYRQDIGL